MDRSNGISSALDDSCAAAAALVDYLGDWFDRAGLSCACDPATRDRLLTFSVERGGAAALVDVEVAELAASHAHEGGMRRLAARIAERADGSLRGQPS